MALSGLSKGFGCESGDVLLQPEERLSSLTPLVFQSLIFLHGLLYIIEKLNKAYMMSGIIKRNFEHISRNCFCNLVFLWLDHTWNIMLIVYGTPKRKKWCRKVECVQKRATKLIPELCKKSYSDWFPCQLCCIDNFVTVDRPENYQHLNTDDIVAIIMIELFRIMKGRVAR